MKPTKKELREMILELSKELEHHQGLIKTSCQYRSGVDSSKAVDIIQRQISELKEELKNEKVLY